jgi:hypothetical protein
MYCNCLFLYMKFNSFKMEHWNPHQNRWLTGKTPALPTLFAMNVCKLFYCGSMFQIFVTIGTKSCCLSFACACMLLILRMCMHLSFFRGTCLVSTHGCLVVDNF